MDDKELAARIKDAAFLTGTFTLRSGRTSNYYLDKYLFAAQPDILSELGRRFAALTEDVDVIAGAELGAVSLAASTSMASGKPFAIVRKVAKEYGTSKRIEGAPVEGRRVLLVEDIGTTAGAALQAAGALTDAGADVARLAFVIDRQEGAEDNVRGAGYEFHALLTKADLGIEVGHGPRRGSRRRSQP